MISAGWPAAEKAPPEELMKRARMCRRLAGESVTPNAARELEKLAARYEALARSTADRDSGRSSSATRKPQLKVVARP